MDDEGNFLRLGSGEDLLATMEGKNGVSVDIPEPLSQYLAKVIIPSVHIRFTWARANGRAGRTNEIILG